ncbi:MAG TPA: hypothetical protein VGU25_01955 [Acidobacteriaceae bacterium]|nr:hypothetical protein [Acidobacteriaceae bacterium]
MNALRLTLFAAASCMLLAGCRVSSNKHANGDNVQVSTPFGSVHVKTDNDANLAGIGLTTYPGAVPVKDHDGKDKDAADINLNFGDFHLGVKAASFQTSDSPDKVEAFYRKDMARYGEVLECEGNQTVGQPTHTAQGLTCRDNDHGSHKFKVSNDDSDHPELRAGSPEHQHIVGIEPRDGGTKIGLVALDLPGGHHDSSDSE